MKALVLKTYIDKDTDKQCTEGEVVEYGTERGRFLAEKGYIRLMDVEKAEPVAPIETKEVKAKAETKPKAETKSKATTKKAPASKKKS